MAQSSVSSMPTVSKLETLHTVSPITPLSLVQEPVSILPQIPLTITELPCSPSPLASTPLPVVQPLLPRIPFMSDTQEPTSASPQTSMTELTAPVSPLTLLTNVSSSASASENTSISSLVTTPATEFDDELNLGDIADAPTGTSKDPTPVDIPSPIVVNPMYVYSGSKKCPNVCMFFTKVDNP